MRYLLVSILSVIFMIKLHAQLGGSHTYAFLNLTNSARAASLGGKTIAIWDNDLNLPFHNPALLNEQMSNHLVMNYVNYFTDINYGYVSYARNVERVGNFAGGIHYINYGDFIAADNYGNKTGTFTASEIALNLMFSHSYDSLFHFGVNLKPVYSVLEQYHSFGLAADIGATYTSHDRLFVASLVLKNIGIQLKGYHDNHKESLPFEVQFGLSQKLEHAPFRFLAVFQNLQKFDLTYSIPGDKAIEVDPLTGEPVDEKKIEVFADKVMRHLIFGVEFIPFKSFCVRAGYNYQRRSELKIDARPAMVGFSWGFGLNISKFNISYGRATYHLAGASNHFSLITNLSSFYKKKS